MPLFKTRTIKHYRKVTPAGSWSDPVITFLRTFNGTVQAFTGDGDFIKNHQMFENVRDFITVDDPFYDVKNGDLLIYNNKIVRVEFSQIHDNGLIPHLAIFAGDTQEDYGEVNSIT